MRLVRYLGAALVALAIGLVPAAPAFAHDGPVTFDVASDGAGGVTVLAVDEIDKHPVEDAMNLVLTATGDSGRTVGPIQLRPTAEGRGFYTSGNVLTPGAWDVTITAGQPRPAKVTVKITARLAQTPPPAAADSSLRRGQDRPGRPGWLWWGLGVVLTVAVVGALVIVLRRRSRPAGSAIERRDRVDA